MSLEGTYHNAQIPFQNATLDSDEHFLFKVRDMQMKATYFFPYVQSCCQIYKFLLHFAPS